MPDGKTLISTLQEESSISGSIRISNRVVIHSTDGQVGPGRTYEAAIVNAANDEEKEAATAFIITNDEEKKRTERLLQIPHHNNVLVALFLDKSTLNHVTHYVLITESISRSQSLRKFLTQSLIGNHSLLSLRKTITRQIVFGLSHLHLNNIVHGSLSPSCVLISRNQAKISFYDFENEDVGQKQTWGEPTNILSKSGDVFSLGLLMYFVISNGKNLGEDCRMITALGNDGELDQTDFTAAMKNLILQMLDRNSSKRPTTEDLLKHEFFQQTALSVQCTEEEVFPVISCRDNVSRGNLELCGVTESDSGPIYNDDDIDGYVGSGMEDPPGQNSAYLLPGDQNKESYRIATFRNFPEYSPVEPRKLASIGFYYTGYKDRVKCFSCGLTVENWTATDDPISRRWHREECAMIRGTESRNEPMMQLNLSRFLDTDALRRPQLTINQQQFLNTGDRRQQTSYDQSSRRDKPTTYNIQFASIHSNEQEALLMSLDLTKESDRRKSFVKWPSYPAPTIPSLLAANGFFYLGNLDRTQCFSCFGVLRNWAADDLVSEEHKKHFPSCRMVIGKDSVNIPLTTSERQRLDDEEPINAPANSSMPTTPPEPNEQEKARLAVIYPCNNAVSAHMRQLESRLETFNNPNWPSHKIKATPRQIAIAGFFYLGEKDKCKCWYCNGGLQNWDPYDEPWTEHSKWFPGCEFVLRNKGSSFVSHLYDQHPNLSRPSIRNAVSFRERNLDIPPQPSTSANQPRSQSKMSSVVEEAIRMGFPSTQVYDLQQKKIATTGSGYLAISDMVEDLLDPQPSQKLPIPMSGASNSIENQMEVEESSGQVMVNEPSPEEDKTNLAATMKSIQNERLCKVCHVKNSDVVFIPCGHLATCEQCGKKIVRCPFPACRTKIEDRIKVFLS